jgi:mannonate dehydratase
MNYQPNVMNEPIKPDRRDFVKQVTLGTVATATTVSFGSLSLPSSIADSPFRAGPMRIGVRMNAHFFKSKTDEDLQFIKQIGVDYVDIDLRLIDRYREDGSLSKSDLQEYVKRLDAAGLRIERANSRAPFYLNALMHHEGGQREIDKLRRVCELVTEAEIPVFGIQSFGAAHVVDNPQLGWASRRGRGGYKYFNFDVARSEQQPSRPKYLVTKEQLWKGLVNIYRQIMPVVEGSKTVIAMHGNDPPMYEYLGNPQIICRYADFDRLFEEVPSKHNGITFCVGTRYESGENVFDGIRHFAQQGKLFHVHFRNVKGTLPVNRGYSEVFHDEGDLDMAQVLRTLHEVGYNGVIDYDHTMGITGDGAVPRQYIAFAVGYMRGLMQSMSR